jgi:CHASE3 domain sensor protein
MSIKDELTRIEDALRGEQAQAASFYATHRKAVLIGVAVLLLVVIAIIVI